MLIAQAGPPVRGGGDSAHFVMGQIVSGFIEETASGYASAQMIGWDVVDFPWAHHFKPDFLPRDCDFELTPKIIARLPLLGAAAFKFAKNVDISNSVRLQVTRLDISNWRQRAAAAGTARVSNFLWSDNNSLLGPVQEEVSTFPAQLTPANDRSGRSNRFRSPPKNNRHMQIRSTPSRLTAENLEAGSSSRWHDRSPSHRSRREIEYFNMAPSSACGDY